MAKISVVMCAYNSENYISEAIESIQSQSYQDFEFLIVNDSSTDNTEKIIKSYQLNDPRIILLQNKYKKGISGAANTGLDAARGEYIARMDSDDISLVNRFEEQVKYLDSNPEIGGCGAWVKLIGINEKIVWQNPTDPDYIKCVMLFYGAISNPVAMFRRSIIEENKLRYISTAAEDYEMYVRLSRITKLTNIPQILLHYRIHQNNFGKINRQVQNESANYIRLKQIIELGINATQEEIDLHCKIGFWEFSNEKSFLNDADNWFRKLINANKNNNIFPEPMLSTLMAEKWFDIYSHSNYLGTDVIFHFLSRLMYSSASKRYRILLLKKIFKTYLSRFIKKVIQII